MNTSRSCISGFRVWHLWERCELKECWLLLSKKIPTSQLFIQMHDANISAKMCCGRNLASLFLPKLEVRDKAPRTLGKCEPCLCVPPRTLLLLPVPPRLTETCCYRRAESISHLSLGKSSFSILQVSGHTYETCLMVSGRLCCVSSSVRHCLDW